MAQIIPLLQGDANTFSQSTPLDGKTYLFRFTFNSREGRWYVALADQNDVLIADSVKLVVNFPLMNRLRDERKPPGVLILVSDNGEECGRNDLGTRCRLIYTSKAELAAAGA